MKKFFALGVLVMVLFLASCGQNPLIQETTSETSKPTTAATRTTKSKEQVINLLTAESKELLIQKPSFDELEDRYDLIQPPWAEEGKTYAVCSMPDVIFYFRNNQANPGTRLLYSIKAPASILLPEYVGMSLDELPFRLEQGSLPYDYWMYGDEYIYWVNLAAPDFLAAESIVTAVAKENQP
ncbi:MAG: hypothetical protein FWH42_05985 [Dehalococcoidia bacterium]|nr:hypothetical protein [Dehalococcoidia bacterium]